MDNDFCGHRDGDDDDRAQIAAPPVNDGSYNTIDGSGAYETIYSTGGHDYVTGGQGNLYVYAGSGNSVYIGQPGFSNTIDYSQHKGDLTLDLQDHTATFTNAAGTSAQYVSGFETVFGTWSGTDVIKGDNAGDTVFAQGANTTFHAGQGADVFAGYGQGADTLVVSQHDMVGGNVKTFEYFTVGKDSVDLRGFSGDHGHDHTRLADVTNADGSHDTMVQALSHGKWANVVDLIGVNINNVGADHHTMTVADLHAHSSTTILA